MQKLRTRNALIAVVAALLIPASGSATAHAAGPDKGASTQYVPGRILVQPRAGLSNTELDQVLKSHGGRRTGWIEGANVHVIALPPQASETAVLNAMRRNPHIKFAELDEYVTPTATLNDPYVASSWHLGKIGAPAAWDLSTGANVVVAVLDTGVDGSHPDLKANLVPGWNIYDNNSNTSDVQGHGTATAGTVGESGNNLIGGAGVSWNARIMPVRIADANTYSTFSLIASGITWAADHGAKVASISYKNLGNSSSVLSAAQYMRGKGGVVVVAAGNEGTLQSTPASSYLTTVAATDSNDARASFSNYGPFVDVAAPGVQVNTTLRGGAYGWGTGTSFSTPIVAAVYAMMKAVNPALSPSQLDTVLFSTATDLGAAGYDTYFGYGRVNAAAAVSAARSTSATDTSSPSTAISTPSGGSKVTGTTAVNVSASDNLGVTKVELYAAGKLVATDTTSPFAFSWNTTAWADGSTSLQAKAYDAAGNYALSSPVAVTVANDTTPPVVTISNPAAGTKVSGTVTIAASATDNKKVSSMTLLIDGRTITTVAGATLSYAWAVAGSTGTTASTIEVRAYDPAGNRASVVRTVYR